MDNVPSSPRVPLEIQEHIVHFLESSSKGTFSAALVCHAWYPSATRRLYNSLEFHDDEQLHRLADLALEHPRVRQYLGFTQIAVFHGPAYSTRFPLALSGLFTTLKILCLHDLTEPLDSGFLQEMSLTVATKLAITEVQLPRSHSRIEQLATALRRLEELDIEHLRAETGGSDLEVARLTPTIRSPKMTVKVHCATMAFNVFHARPMPSTLFPMWGMNTVPSFDPPFRKQRSLCIAFMGWLTDVSSCRPTLSLELVRDLPQNCSWSPQREDHDVHVEDVNQVLRKAGPSLYLFKVVYSAQTLPLYDLSRNPNLTCIHFTLPYGRSWHAIADALYRMMRGITVSMDSTACISEIGIALKYKNSLGWLQEMPNSTSLSALHAVLTSPAYSSLSRAEIRYAGVHRANWRSQEAEDGAKACVRALMEPWYKRNVLILTPIDLYDWWS